MTVASMFVTGSKGGGIHMTGVDQNGNKVDTYVNAKLYYTTASRVWEEWVYDRTYVKLREVSLSYVFPSQTLKKLNIGLSRASVAINASNPWLIYQLVLMWMCLKLVWDILRVVMPLQPVR